MLIFIGLFNLAIFIVGILTIVYFILNFFKNELFGIIIAFLFIMFTISVLIYVEDNIQTDKEFLIKKCIEYNITLPEKYKDIIKDILKDRYVEKYLNRG